MFDELDRLEIRLKTYRGTCMALKIEWLRFKRELDISIKRSKFYKIYILLYGE